MNAFGSRLLITCTGLLAATPALPQTSTVTVYARMSGGGGAVGRVDLAPASASTSPAIACATNSPASCVGQATTGTTVILQPSSVSNATFVSWSGCSSLTPAGPGVPLPLCNLVMTSARTVTATFKPATYGLTARTYPALVSGSPPPAYVGWLQAPTTPAIDCQTGNPAYPACTGRADNGTTVLVTAVPGPLAKVTSWSGCAASTATTCSVAMTSDRTVSATFGAADISITAAVQGTGTISAPLGGDVVDGMSCPTDCGALVVPAGTITFTATPGPGAQFVGWTGCPSTTPTCTLANVTAPVSISATFNAATCSSCHGVPPQAPHPDTLECGNCHSGYTSTSVNATTHMNGVLDVSCTQCHGHPPVPPHVQRDDCGTCHGPLYATGVDSARHRNGQVDPRHSDTYEPTCPGPDTTPACVQCHPCVNQRP